jgi:hypothetical protein
MNKAEKALEELNALIEEINTLRKEGTKEMNLPEEEAKQPFKTVKK